jgi:hypothetical protein
MKPGKTIESVIYAIVIVLSLAAAGIAVISPAPFTNLKLVYGGF